MCLPAAGASARKRLCFSKSPTIHARPIFATIHTEALRHNLVWAVVKADAYGHGIERVYEGLRGADGFALLDLNEAPSEYRFSVPAQALASQLGAALDPTARVRPCAS